MRTPTLRIPAGGEAVLIYQPLVVSLAENSIGTDTLITAVEGWAGWGPGSRSTRVGAGCGGRGTAGTEL